MKSPSGKATIALFLRLLVLTSLMLIPLLVWTSSAEMFESPKQMYIKIAAFGAAFLVILNGGFNCPPSLLWPGFLVLSAGLVSSVVSPLTATSLFGEYTSYQGWFHWVSLGAVFLALLRLTLNRLETRRLLWGFTLSASLVSLYALLQIVGLDPVAWTIEGPIRRTFSTSGNALFLGSFLTAALPAVMGLSMAARTRASRISGTVSAAVIFCALLSTGSRSALIASIAGIIVFFVSLRSSALIAVAFARNLAVTLLLILSLGAMLLPGDRNPFPLLLERTNAVLRGEDGRVEIWKGALRMVREAPILGQGLDTFATFAYRVQTPELWKHVWHGSPEKAHSEPLQIAASIGIGGAGAVIWLLAVLAQAAKRIVRWSPFEAGAAAGLVALGIQSLFGFTTCSPQITALLLAAILASALPARPLPLAASRILIAILAAGMLAGLHFAVCDVALKVSLRHDGRNVESLVALKTPWAEQILRAGDTLEHRWFGPELRTMPVSEDRKLAILLLLYDTALKINPLHPLAHSSMGRTQLRLGNPGEALKEYGKAVELAPMDAYVALEYVQTLFGAGKPDEALGAAEALARAYPDFAEPYGMIGYYFLSHADQPRAEIYLRKALAADWHGNGSAAFAAAANLASIFRSSGRNAEAAWAEQQALRYAAPRDNSP